MNLRILASAVLVAGCLPLAGHADTVTIMGDPNAPTSNFQNPGNTATVGYTINTSGNGTSVVVALSTSDPNALDFANLYFETVANDATMGSNVGFEASATAVNDAFNPTTGQKYDVSSIAGFSSVETNVNGVKTITVTVPDSFFETDPDGIGFPKTPDGTDVSLHLSQSFSYSVVGGSANFPRPAELGLAEVGGSAVTPEPPSVQYMALALVCCGIAGSRKYLQSRQAF